MPLHILLILVVSGIGSIAVLLHLLGLSKTKVFSDENAARQAWSAEFDDMPAGDIVLSHDKHTALVECEAGLGIIWPMGADSTARLLQGATLTRTQCGLHIQLPDFTAPHVNLRLDADEANVWMQKLEPKT